MKKIIKFVLFIFLAYGVNAQEFITTWNMSNAGLSPTQIVFGVGTIGTVNYTWETIPLGATGSGSFNGTAAIITGLPAGALIRLKIDSTNFKRIIMNNGTDKFRLVNVDQWGSIAWASMANAFYGCGNLNISATDVPDLSNLTDLSVCFKKCSMLNSPLNINLWNVSNVINLSYMFEDAIAFNQPLGNWDVSGVTSMAGMFKGAYAFNQLLDSWDVSNVINTGSMFEDANAFNQPLSNWDVSNAIYMGWMFAGADSFNQPIGNWDVSNVIEMNAMFSGNAGPFTVALNSFNQPLGNWDVSNVTSMSQMFMNSAFNQPIDNWDVSNVTNMSYMFAATGSAASGNIHNVFNQPLNNWNVSSVIDMGFMFSYDTMFNQSLSNWDVSNANNIGLMFSNAKHYNQPITTWTLNPNVNLYDLFAFSGMDCTNYSSTLNAWANNINIPSNRILGAFNVKYGTNAIASRNYLINTKGWTITNDIASGFACCVVTTSNFSTTSCNAYTFNNQVLTTSGIYYDTLLNASGCDSIISLNLTINNPNTGITQVGAVLTANTNLASYQWITCNPTTVINGANAQTYTATSNGDYALIVTQNGCTDTSNCITVLSVGLNNLDGNSTIQLIPNPAHNFLEVRSEIGDLKNADIKMYNAIGQLVYSSLTSNPKSNISNLKSNISIDISSFASGIYFLEIKQDGKVERMRILKN